MPDDSRGIRCRSASGTSLKGSDVKATSGWIVERQSHHELSESHGSGEADESIGLLEDEILRQRVRTGGRHNPLGARRTFLREGEREVERGSLSDELGRVDGQGNALNGQTP